MEKRREPLVHYNGNAGVDRVRRLVLVQPERLRILHQEYLRSVQVKSEIPEQMRQLSIASREMSYLTWRLSSSQAVLLKGFVDQYMLLNILERV